VIIGASAGLAAASLAGGYLFESGRVAPAREQLRKSKPVNSGHNILFVFTDQERHFDRWPRLLDLPGHERLARNGTYFDKHHDQTRTSEIAGRELPGKDFAALLSDPRGADVHAVRDAALFTYSGIASNDGDLMPFIANAKAAGKDPKAEMAATGFRPNLKKRGSVRSMSDGRYTFSRYFSPTEHHKPANLDELYKYNDLELYDREKDPGEQTNLAADRAANGDLVLAMNAKLETIIAAEIGIDDGRELPDVEGIDWALPQDRFD